jgi:deazaflavin-dependent oxidoreductase (nitroreductase family)
MEEQSGFFEKPSLGDRIFNSVVGALVRVGIGLPQMRVLEVRGRKSGKLYRLPVDLLPDGGKLFLVAPRGRAQWVRNAEASPTIVLRRGSKSEEYSLRALSGDEKNRILAAYLARFHREVPRFFPLPAGSPAESFAPLAARYPAFELTRS